MTPNDQPQRSTAGAPPTPSRVRVVRPGFYRSAATGSLPPDVRDLLIGLTTLSDDEGWLIWQPAELAAWIYPYAPAGKRLRDLERRAARLIDAGLVIVEPCGCAFLPTLKEQHGVKGGNKSTAIWGWHLRHESGQVRTETDESVSGSSSSLGSSLGSVAGSSSSRAGNSAPPRDGAGDARCLDCGRPTSVHLPSCPVLVNPALLRVVS